MTRTSLLLAAALLAPAVGSARPPYKKALAEFVGPALPKALNDCVACHLPAAPDAEERPHNPFGEHLADLKADHKDITARLKAAADADSDGDGVANLLELLAGRAPGDPNDTPTAAEVAKAKLAAVALANKPAGYAWKPFEPVRRPPVPKVGEPHPVDAFVAVEHQARGLTPRPEADRRTLARRLSIDLTGLPPTPEEVEAFAADDSPGAYEAYVDRLLASPRYGERWGRHWMDVWRYSDWDGYRQEVRFSQPHVWRWRDWIVESLNADKPYDRMVVEMLAGDEVAPGDPDTLRATGFLVRNWFKFNRNTWLDNTVEHTAKAFLGVTLNCARCHDHFFDPLTQAEYYQFRAVFEAHDVRTDRLPGRPDTKKDGLVRAFDGRPADPTFLFVRGDEANPDKAKPLGPATPAALGGGPLMTTPISLPAEAAYPDRRPFVVEEDRKGLTDAAAKAKTAAGTAAKRLLAARTRAEVWPAAQAFASAALDVELTAAKRRAFELAVADEAAGSTKTHEKAVRAGRAAKVLEAQVARVAAGKVAGASRAAKVAAADKVLEAAVAAVAGPVEPSEPARPQGVYPTTSTGRRLALAKWITDEQNPLAARVAVNHVWQRHFGVALVPTVFDFGANGQVPTHPALLDWLAAEFMAGDWSMKRLHRLIVTSQAYRRDSRSDPESVKLDRDNRTLWRANVRRMEAEAVRDGVLAAAGALDPTTGGPDLDHTLAGTVYRRSLYFRHSAEKQNPFLQLFDAANVSECYQRTESVVPQQALGMANSPLVRDQARRLAKRLADGDPSDAEYVDRLFATVLGRPATPDEVRECAIFLKEQAARLADGPALTPFAGTAAGTVAPAEAPADRARESLAHVLLNHNDFVTVR